MSDFVQMHVFFFVTTIAVVLFAILSSIVLIRIMRILKRVEEFSTMVNEEGKQIREDLKDIREDVHSGKARLGRLIGLTSVLKKHKHPKS